MPIIDINVQNKIATAPQDAYIICGNSDYVINFTFDTEWDGYTVKTARFSYNGMNIDITFTGNLCNVPIINDSNSVEISVYSGVQKTSIAAMVACVNTALSDSGLQENTEEVITKKSRRGVMLLSATPETEPHIVINSDRTVSVPDELIDIAVQFDHNIETVTFDCPRYWDGNDFANMRIYVNYRCADGKMEPYPCEPPTIDETDESIIHFKWTISRNVTCAKGKISFLVCVKNTDENGVLRNRWSSRLNQQMEILEGLECASEEIVSENPDMIEYILSRLDTVPAGTANPDLVIGFNRLHILADTITEDTFFVEEGTLSNIKEMVLSGKSPNIKIRCVFLTDESHVEYNFIPSGHYYNFEDGNNSIIIEFIARFGSSLKEYTMKSVGEDIELNRFTEASSANIVSSSSGGGEMTADSIEKALGYTPADDADVNKLSKEITGLAAEDCNFADIWEQGYISDSGKPGSSTQRLRTTGYISKFVAKVHTSYPYSFKVFAYNDAGTYVGVWNGSGFAQSNGAWITELDLSQFGGMNYRYRVMFRRDNDANITPESYTYIHFTNAMYSTIEAVRTESAEKTDELFDAVAGDMNNTALWVNGSITETGSESKASNVVRTASYIPDGVKLIYAKGNWIFMAFLYDENDILVGVWGGTGIIQTASKWLYYLMPEHLSGYKIRLIARRRDGADITVNDVVADVHFLNEIHAKAFYRTPTLTFIDDDGSLNALENWESITDEIGVKITSALVTGVMGDGETNPLKASWADVARLQNKGYEFVSHTHDHIKIPERTDEVVIEQFESTIAALREHGCESRYLVYPYNAIDSAKMPLVKKYFTAAVGLGKETENILPVQTHDLKRVSINSEALIDKEYNGESVQVAGFRSLDELKGYIDRTLINGGWLIIMTHLRNDNSYYHDDASRTMIIDLCKYAVENGMLIQTFGEAFQRYKNIMETGTVNDSTYYITDCNGVVRYR